MMRPLLLFCCLALAGLEPAAGAELLHSIELHPDVIVHWTPENETNSVTIRVEARTRGWAAVGFSPAGGMAGADIVLAWVADGRAHIQDMYAVGNDAPMLDKRQDVELVDGYENATHTVFTFRRPLRSCDTEHDLDLGMDTTRLIWALHPSDPAGGSVPSYHGPRRGVRSLSLDGSGTFQFPARGESLSFVLRNTDTQVVEEHTHYHCEIHRLPDLGQNVVHYTGFRVVLDPATAPHVHHILLMTCSLPPSMHSFFEEYATSHPGAKCYSPNMPPSWLLCKPVTIVWAVGSDGDMLPENVGMPLGNENGHPTYFMMETHYDNPQILSGLRDNSGLEVFYSRSFRPVEAGLISAGHAVTSTQLVPPGQALFTTGGVCPRQCTQKHLPSEGVRIHSVMLHGHLAARSIRVRQIRAGRELPILIEDKYYDFNYQQGRRVDPSLRILPGDELIVECDYETRDRNNVIMGGFSTRNEMCLAFITYFPRSPLTFCTSKPHIGEFLHSMDVQAVSVGGIGMPPIAGAEHWNTAFFRHQQAVHTRVLDGDLMKRRNRTLPARGHNFNEAELSSLSVSVDGDSPSVGLYDYLMSLHWSSPAVRRLQRAARGGSIYHNCFSEDVEKFRDYRNTFSGPHPYPEFEPFVPEENTGCVEAMKASADHRSRLSGATVVLAVSVLRLLV